MSIRQPEFFEKEIGENLRTFLCTRRLRKTQRREERRKKKRKNKTWQRVVVVVVFYIGNFEQIKTIAAATNNTRPTVFKIVGLSYVLVDVNQRKTVKISLNSDNIPR